MCFYIRNTEESRTLWVAKEDIVCYKVLKPYRQSSIIGFMYKLNTTYKEKRFIIPECNGKIYIFSNYKWLNTYTSRPLEYGFHSFIELKRAKEYAKVNFEYLYKCIIPKGSEFYYDPIKKQYLSNQIKIVKKLT